MATLDNRKRPMIIVEGEAVDLYAAYNRCDIQQKGQSLGNPGGYFPAGLDIKLSLNMFAPSEEDELVNALMMAASKRKEALDKVIGSVEVYLNLLGTMLWMEKGVEVYSKQGGYANIISNKEGEEQRFSQSEWREAAKQILVSVALTKEPLVAYQHFMAGRVGKKLQKLKRMRLTGDMLRRRLIKY